MFIRRYGCGFCSNHTQAVTTWFIFIATSISMRFSNLSRNEDVMVVMLPVFRAHGLNTRSKRYSDRVGHRRFSRELQLDVFNNRFLAKKEKLQITYDGQYTVCKRSLHILDMLEILDIFQTVGESFYSRNSDWFLILTLVNNDQRLWRVFGKTTTSRLTEILDTIYNYRRVNIKVAQDVFFTPYKTHGFRNFRNIRIIDFIVLLYRATQCHNNTIVAIKKSYKEQTIYFSKRQR